MRSVKLSPEAARELDEAAAWYEQESPGLGDRLVDAFEHALDLLREDSPPLVPVRGDAGRQGARRLLLHRFPYSIVTIEHNDDLVVVAFAHHARRPGYWIHRLPT